MWPNPQFPSDLITFTENILNGQVHFFVFNPLVPDAHKIV